MISDDRKTMIDLLNRSEIDYMVSESELKDTIIISTDDPNAFVEFRFQDPGPILGVEIVDWNGVQRA